MTMTLEINDNVFDKFKWLLSHFSNNEVKIIKEFDFDEIDDIKLEELKRISQDYKSGKREDFVKYEL